ncbi:MAG TPA: hypothetical protein VL306_02505 [Methylomirabilota bacterium]|nr:hypothetical protein [Methylomirabilota bacterium]
MKYIIVCGPTAAGKDTVIDELVKEINQEKPGLLNKTWYYTTRREVRPGEDPNAEYFLSEEEFDQKIARGEFFSHGTNAGYRVATSYSQLNQEGNIVISITTQYLERLKDYAAKNGVEALSILVTAPREVRANRIRMRESWLFTEPVEDKIEQDISKEGTELGKEFDIRIENKEGQFDETMREVIPKVREFLSK